MKILAAGGGSGGHVSPVVAVINELVRTEPTLEALFLCDKAFEQQARGLMEKADTTVNVRVISAGKIRRYAHLTFWQHLTVRGLVWNNFKDLFKMGRGYFQSIAIMRRFRPDVVFTKGGYVCLPVGAAAHLLKIPLVIHDSDTRPGLTNRLLSRWATVIATGAPLENYNYPVAKSHYTGVPISATFRPKTASQQAKAKEAYGFNPERLLVVAVGGGLGAKSINAAMVNAAKGLLEQGMGVYLVTGKGHFEEVKSLVPANSSFKAVPFVYDNMDQLLGAADIVVSRGSATFLQELAGLGKAVVIVPAKQLGDQLMNAKAFQAAGAAVVVDDERIGQGDTLERAILELADDPVLRERIGKKLHTFAKPRATKDLAKLILTAAKR